MLVESKLFQIGNASELDHWRGTTLAGEQTGDEKNVGLYRKVAIAGNHVHKKIFALAAKIKRRPLTRTSSQKGCHHRHS